MIILDLSEDADTLIEQQGIDLYEELQQEVPSLRLARMPDPGAPAGSRDLATVIFASAALVTALTPIIIRILNQYTPPDVSGQWDIEETETRHLDGCTTIQRKYIHSRTEQRPWITGPYPQTQSSPEMLAAPSETKDEQG
jgi:hypothetical protein